jgi:hypothetical protein
MKPNGRRAWRKWLKSQRKHDKDSWAANIGACLGRAAYARRHRGTDAGQGLPDVVPTVSATPFTARSLVGMPMGARKRLYQRIVDAFPTEGDAFLIDTEGKGVPIGWLLSRRLRPCPGCSLCKGVGCYACYPKFDQDCDACVDGLICLCDGSGVLPARKQK